MKLSSWGALSRINAKIARNSSWLNFRILLKPSFDRTVCILKLHPTNAFNLTNKQRCFPTNHWPSTSAYQGIGRDGISFFQFQLDGDKGTKWPLPIMCRNTKYKYLLITNRYNDSWPNGAPSFSQNAPKCSVCFHNDRSATVGTWPIMPPLKRGITKPVPRNNTWFLILLNPEHFFHCLHESI
jgi:hypothetical protein